MERLLASKEGTDNGELVYLKATADGRLKVDGIGISVDALTQEQLLESGMGTALNQLTMIGYLADLSDGNDKWAAYKLVQTEDLGEGTKYLLKSDGTNWLLIRKTYADTASEFGYATAVNNTSVTTLSAAWAARTTLTYGTPAP